MKKRVCRIVCQNNYWKSDFVNFTLKSGLFCFFAAALTPRTPRGIFFAKWVAFGLIFMVFSAVFSHRSTSPSSTRDQRTCTRQSYTHDTVGWTEAHTYENDTRHASEHHAALGQQCGRMQPKSPKRPNDHVCKCRTRAHASPLRTAPR